MGFQKHNWGSFNRSSSGNTVYIEIKDGSDRKIDWFRCNSKKEYAKIIKLIKDKYGFTPEAELEDSPNFDKEKDWLKSDLDWN